MESAVEGGGVGLSIFGSRGGGSQIPRKGKGYWDNLRVKNDALEKMYRPKDDASDKVAQMGEMAYMRKELDRDRTALNITYPVNPPFAFVNVTFDRKTSELRYVVKEPSLKEGERELIGVIKGKMEGIMAEEEIPLAEGAIFGRSPALEEYLRERYEEVLDLYDIAVEERRKPVLLYYLQRELLGLGRSDAILRDPFIEDISCNGPRTPIYIYHRVFGSVQSNVIYESDLELNRYVFKLAQVSGKHVSVYQPILDATLTDGSRINLTLGTEVTRGGSTFSIRKFSYDPISPIDLLRFKSISPMQLAYLWHLIENKRSVLLSGGTASGKTTLLNAMSMFIRPEDKIVSIEDTPEIHIDHENWIQSVARSGYGMAAGGGTASGIAVLTGARPGSVSLFDLLVAALRQRPEYVLVGEVRGREAFTLFQAISVGHASMSTIHAGSIDELMHRVENEPMNIPRELFQSLDVVAFMGQMMLNGRKVRRIKAITEILDIEKDTRNLLTNDSFTWDARTDSFNFSGRSFLLEAVAKANGKDIDDVMKEIGRKEAYLKMMDRRNITFYKDVSKAINSYYVDPVAATLALGEGKP
jgi:flagellar protein FlaI